MPELDRDRSVEHVLRRVLSERDSGPSQNTCPDAELIAAWHEGSLRAGEAAAIEDHIADCTRCLAVSAAFIASSPATPPVEPLWRRWHLGWVVPLATAATAALLWIAVPGSRPTPVPATPSASPEAIRPAAPPATPAPPSAPSAAEALSKAIAPADNEDRKPVAEAQRAGTQPQDARAAADAALTTRTEVDRRERAAAPSAAPSALARQAMPQLEILAPGGEARWRIVGGRQVERSTSAATEWGPAAIDSVETLTAGAAPSASVCWLVGRRGAVYITVDGTRFMRLPFPGIADLVAVSATDERTATVSASDGRSWRTTDQGASWSMPD